MSKKVEQLAREVERLRNNNELLLAKLIKLKVLTRAIPPIGSKRSEGTTMLECGDYWLSAEGRKQLRDVFSDKDDGNSVRPLLDEVERLEGWANKYTDRMLKERACAENRIKELRDEIERLQTELSYALASEKQLRGFLNDQTMRANKFESENIRLRKLVAQALYANLVQAPTWLAEAREILVPTDEKSDAIRKAARLIHAEVERLREALDKIASCKSYVQGDVVDIAAKALGKETPT